MVYRKKKKIESKLLRNKKYTYLGGVLSNLVEQENKSLPSLVLTPRKKNKKNNSKLINILTKTLNKKKSTETSNDLLTN